MLHAAVVCLLTVFSVAYSQCYSVVDSSFVSNENDLISDVCDRVGDLPQISEFESEDEFQVRVEEYSKSRMKILSNSYFVVSAIAQDNILYDAVNHAFDIEMCMFANCRVRSGGDLKKCHKITYPVPREQAKKVSGILRYCRLRVEFRVDNSFDLIVDKIVLLHYGATLKIWKL